MIYSDLKIINYNYFILFNYFIKNKYFYKFFLKNDS